MRMEDSSLLRRASRPAAGVHARLFRCAKSGSWRTRARSKTLRSLLGSRRVWKPAAGGNARPTWPPVESAGRAARLARPGVFLLLTAKLLPSYILAGDEVIEDIKRIQTARR